MKRDYPERPIIGVGAVIIHRDRVLLVRRATEPLKGEWSVPGGMLELGEKLRDGLRREVLEETGLQVEPGEVLDVFDSIFRDEQGRTQYHYVLIDYLCRAISEEAKAGKRRQRGQVGAGRGTGGDGIARFHRAGRAQRLPGGRQNTS